MKNKFLLIISSVMLVSCGGTINGSSISSPTTSVNPNTSDSFIKEEVSNGNLEMFMYGGLYLNGMRTIYAKLSEQYKDSEIVWESSDESIVSATGRENLSSECLVTALDYGVAYVKASLKDNPSIYSVKKFEIKKGEAMPVELFNSISGAVTMNTTDQYIMVDNKYNETVTKTEYLDVIYEENDSLNCSSHSGCLCCCRCRMYRRRSDCWRMESRKHAGNLQ